MSSNNYSTFVPHHYWIVNQKNEEYETTNTYHNLASCEVWEILLLRCMITESYGG